MANIINFEDWLADNSEKKSTAFFLSEKEVRSCPGFEEISDEEVVNLIHTLHQFALLTYPLVTAELNGEMLKVATA